MKRLLALLLVAVPAVAYGAVRSPEAAPRARAAATTLSVTIMGPHTLATNEGCSWYAVVSGGTPPYTYTWSQTINAIGTGSGEDWNGYFRGSGSLTVNVTDANQNVGSRTLSVTTSPSGPLCP